MPYLNAKIAGTTSTDIADTVATVLADLTVDVLKKKRELTSVAVEFVPETQWFVGGASVGSQNTPTFYLDVKVTEGTNTKDEKSVYVAQVFAAMESLLGNLHPASYVVIHEVRGDAWGYQGLTQEFRYIKGKPLQQVTRLEAARRAKRSGPVFAGSSVAWYRIHPGTWEDGNGAFRRTRSGTERVGIMLTRSWRTTVARKDSAIIGGRIYRVWGVRQSLRQASVR
jgi:4-oxalocrotonate tautomerase